MTQGELEKVWEGGVNITQVDSKSFRKLLKDVEESNHPRLIARLSWLQTNRQQMLEEHELAILVSSPKGFEILRVDSATHNRVRTPAEGGGWEPDTRTLQCKFQTDEWYVTTVREGWCGRQGKYRSKVEIESLLRKSKADEGARTRVQTLCNGAPRVPSALNSM